MSFEEADDIYTREDDPRITRVGRWLRKLRLDELPQLWNVLRGEMSLIGPRAEWIKCAERYEKKIPFYHFRHLVKPGITGWAQVNYPYGESDEDAIEKLKYDLYYIRQLFAEARRDDRVEDGSHRPFWKRTVAPRLSVICYWLSVIGYRLSARRCLLAIRTGR